MEVLEGLFKHVGIRAASVSIDDFYLTFADQQQLAKVRDPAPSVPSALQNRTDSHTLTRTL